MMITPTISIAKEYKAVSLRDIPMPAEMKMVDTPEKVVAYWRTHIATHPAYNPDVETLAVLFLTTRRTCRGHQLLATGTLDTLLAHPRETFRLACIIAAAAIVLVHNHPSGEPTPSEADVKVTRDMIRAGQLLKIELLDHVIVGHKDHVPDHCSLRGLGYFYT